MKDEDAESGEFSRTGELLGYLDPDPSIAATKLEAIRRRLIRLFEWRGVMLPEDLADATIVRVTDRLASGVKISSDPYDYFVGVAHLAYREHLRSVVKDHGLISDLDMSGAAPDTTDSADDELRLSALRETLQNLAPDQRELFIRYHQTEEARRDLARDLGIGLSALRIRVHRLRRKVEDEVKRKLRGAIPGPPEILVAETKPESPFDLKSPERDADFLLIWDPDVLNAEEYSELVQSLGDLVRACGGLGVVRAQPDVYSVPANVVVPV